MGIDISNHGIKTYMYLFQPSSAMCLIEVGHWLDTEYGKTWVNNKRGSDNCTLDGVTLQGGLTQE